MTKTRRTVALLAGVPVATGLMFATPALAGYAAAPVAGASWGPAAATATPNTNVVGSGQSSHFDPKKLSVGWSFSKKEKCTNAHAAFTITNATKQDQTVMQGGKPFGPALKPGYYLGVCTWGTGTYTFKYSLKSNPKATLTATAS